MIFGNIYRAILEWAKEHSFIGTAAAVLVVVVAAACGRLFGVPGMK
jgi:hypothetical protein